MLRIEDMPKEYYERFLEVYGSEEEIIKAIDKVNNMSLEEAIDLSKQIYDDACHEYLIDCMYEHSIKFPTKYP